MFDFRRASEVEVFPYNWVSYVVVGTEGTLDCYSAPSSIESKKQMVKALKHAKDSHATVLAPRRVESRRDVYVIDNIDIAITSISRSLCLS